MAEQVERPAEALPASEGEDVQIIVPRTALVTLADGFEEIEALAAVDILRRGGVDVTMASIHDRLDVKGAHGIVVKADALLKDVPEAGWGALVLPGGGQGTANLAACAPLVARIRRAAERWETTERCYLCAICAAPTVFERAEVFPGDVHVTCYPACAPQMQRPVADAPAVADNQFITGQAPGAALAFGLAVLENVTDPETAAKVAEDMVM